MSHVFRLVTNSVSQKARPGRAEAHLRRRRFLTGAAKVHAREARMKVYLDRSAKHFGRIEGAPKRQARAPYGKQTRARLHRNRSMHLRFSRRLRPSRTAPEDRCASA